MVCPQREMQAYTNRLDPIFVSVVATFTTGTASTKPQSRDPYACLHAM